jgi:hypothetical protein
MEIVALMNGIDGIILTMSVAAVAGIGGYNIKKYRG